MSSSSSSGRSKATTSSCSSTHQQQQAMSSILPEEAAIHAPSSSGSSSVPPGNVAPCSSFELDAWIRDEPMPDCLMDVPEVELMEPCSSSAMHAASSNQQSQLCFDPAAAAMAQQVDCSSSSIGLGDVFDEHKDQQQQQDCKSFVPDLKKIIVKKPIMDKAVERLGGGRKGAIRLWKFIQVWLAEQQQHHQQQQLDGMMIPFELNEMQLNWDVSNTSSSPSSRQLYANAFAGRHQHQQHHFSYPTAAATAAAVAAPADHHYYAAASGYTNNESSNTNATTPPEFAMSPAATTRAARKSRMARQRRHLARSSQQQQQSQQPVACSWPAGTSSVLQAQVADQAAAPREHHHPAAYTCRDGKQQVDHQHHHHHRDKNLKFLLQKELRPSDVGNLGRVVLPKKEAEVHLPYLSFREGITLPMEDFKSGRIWSFRYRFWPNNKSRMYLLEGIGEFVKAHCLKEGDVLQIFRDCRTGIHVIHGKKGGRSVVKHEDDSSVSGVSSVTDARAARVSVSALESTVSSIQALDDEAARVGAPTLAASAARCNAEDMGHFPSLDLGDEFIEEIMSLVDSTEEPSSPDSCKEDS